MNSKIVSRKITSAIFLAIVLVAGTIALSSPSFLVGAQLEQTCKDCFSVLNDWQISKLLRFANEASIGTLSDRLASITNSQHETFRLIEFLSDAGGTPEQVGAITEDLVNSGIIDRPAQERGPLCADGIDNNGNTLVDFNDPTDCIA